MFAATWSCSTKTLTGGRQHEHAQAGAAAPRQPDPNLMETIRLVVELANTFGVDLRVAAAIQRGDITVTPGGGSATVEPPM